MLDDLLSLAYDRVQMSLVTEALCVDFVDVLRAGGPRRKPPAVSDNLQTTDRRAVAWGTGQLRGYGFAGES